MVRDNHNVLFIGAKSDPDYKCHVFGPDNTYWDSLMPQEVKLFNDGYIGFRIEKVRMYVELSLDDFKIMVTAAVSTVHTFYPSKLALNYLWHYSYDGKHDTTDCDKDFVDQHCLTYGKRIPENGHIRHRVT
jgi:hypothetical protein